MAETNHVFVQRIEELTHEGKLLINELMQVNPEHVNSNPKVQMVFAKFEAWIFSYKKLVDRMKNDKLSLLLKETNIPDNEPLALPLLIKILDEVKLDLLTKNK